MSIVNIEGECLKGESAVATLRTFYASVGSPQEFYSAVESIGSRFDSLNSSWTREIPFTPVCGEIAQLGNEADSLRAQIASAYGQVDVPADTRVSPLDQGAEMLKWALLGIAAIVGFNLYTASKVA